MILKEVIQKSLEDLKDIGKIQAALFLTDGSYYAGTLEEEQFDESILRSFLSSEAEFQELLGFYLFRIEEEEQYVLVIRGNKADASVIGRLAASQIQNLILVNQEKNSQENFLKSFLEGKMTEELARTKADKFHINLDHKRGVFLLEMEREAEEKEIVEIIKYIGEYPEEDSIFFMEENRIVFLMKIEEEEGEEKLKSTACTLADMIQAEVMEKVRVAYGTPSNHMMDLPDCYREAKIALEVGKIFYAGKSTISFHNLGIGRLLYRLPKELCETFMKEVVGTNLDEVLDQETLGTIYRFFENGLNVSETARQLYVHRNTLVYRLEKIQKQLGLDIRQFDDAVTFKIAMMVDNYLKYINLYKSGNNGILP